MRFIRKVAIVAAATFALVSTGGAALACEYPPPEVCYETRDNPDYVPEQRIEHPAETHEVTVVVSAGTWENFSPNDQQATFVGPPSHPSDERGTWQHQGDGKDIPGGHQGPDGVYAQGNPDKGGNWFYRQAPVTRTDTVVDKEAWTEIIPAVGKPTIQVEVPCEEEPIEVTPFLDFTPPTCDEPGSLGLMSGPESGVIWNDTEGEDGSVVYTASAAPGFVFPEGAIVEFIVPNLAQLPEDSDECYVPPPPPVCEDEDVPVWHVWTGGSVESDEGPSADDPAWNANSGNPQSANHAFENHEPGVPYFVSHGNSGKGDWFLWTLEDCPPPPTDVPVGVQFDIPTTPPTCDAAEQFGAVFPIVREGYSITVDRPYDGPGVYTLTATAADGFVFSGEGNPVQRTHAVTLAGKVVQGCAAPPTQAPGPPAPPAPPVVTVVHQPPVTPTYLASTGSEGALGYGLAALALLGLGTALTVARRRYSLR